MNLYFLVEGERTEKKIYPKWLSFLIPELKEVKYLHEVVKYNYYVFNGNGIDSLKKHLKNAIADVNETGSIDYFVLCLDAEEFSVEDRRKEFTDYLISEKIVLVEKTKFLIIVQNRCIETWLLGNRKIVKRNPVNKELRDYLAYYNVSVSDPELLDKFNFSTHAQFHEIYLRKILLEREISYSKRNPQIVSEHSYLIELIERATKTNHIQTFQVFLDFCIKIRNSINI